MEAEKNLKRKNSEKLDERIDKLREVILKRFEKIERNRGELNPAEEEYKKLLEKKDASTTKKKKMRTEF